MNLDLLARIVVDGTQLRSLLDTYELKPTRKATDDQIAEVVRNLTAEFTWPCEADTLALLVYGGLKKLTERSVLHMEDPTLSWATTALRHALDVVRHAPWETFDDVSKAITVGFDMWDADSNDTDS